jgi:hypothetical protein
MAFDRELIKAKAASLATNGVYIGTSSWKYPGWRGMLYDEQRHIYRGKFNETRWKRIVYPNTPRFLRPLVLTALIIDFQIKKPSKIFF